jgi:hypothetical protein
MALPATGTAMRQYADVSVFFSGPSTNVALGTLGAYISITVGNQISLSSSFGGIGPPDYP